MGGLIANVETDGLFLYHSPLPLDTTNAFQEMEMNSETTYGYHTLGLVRGNSAFKAAAAGWGEFLKYFDVVKLQNLYGSRYRRGDENEKIRALKEANQALQQKVEEALENERKAREEVQSIALAPTANVAVVMGDAEITNDVLDSPEDSRDGVLKGQACDYQNNSNSRSSRLVVGCVCVMFVGTIVGILFGVSAFDTDNPSGASIINCREYLQGIIYKDLEPCTPRRSFQLVNGSRSMGTRLRT